MIRLEFQAHFVLSVTISEFGQNLFLFRYLVERAVERLRRQGEAQFAGVSADLEAR